MDGIRNAAGFSGKGPPKRELNAFGDPAQFIDSLSRQLGLIAVLKGLVQEQRELIAGGRIDALTALISRRQTLVNELVESQRALGPFAEASESDLRLFPEPVRREARRLIQRIGEDLSIVLNADAADQASLQDGCRRVQGELAGLGAGRNARHAYVERTAAPTRFADHTG